MNRVPRTLLTCAVLALAAALGGCGGDQDASDPLGTGAGSATVAGGAGHEAVEVIKDWSDTLSDGDVEGASDYFAIPSVVENGTPPINLTTRTDVEAFNDGLPCGAELVRAVPDGNLIDATFRLKERPGGDCGPGVGGLAATAFEVKDGKITQWRRLDDLGAPSGGGGSGPLV